MARVECMASENIYMYMFILTVFLQLTYEVNEELQDNLRAKMQKNWVEICAKTVGAEGDPSFGEELAALKLTTRRCGGGDPCKLISIANDQAMPL